MSTLPTPDLIVLVIYMVAIVLIGVRAGRNASASSDGYFLANKSLMWPMIGASFFASNISTVHLVGLSESGFKHGIVWGNFEWFSVVELIILAFVFIPFYIHTRITTLPEFLEKRYDKRSRMLLAIFSIFAALFMHIGVSLYAGAVVFQTMFHIDILLSILIIAVATGIYTVIGGFVSVVVTETVQTVLLLAGSFTVLWLAIYKLPEVGIHSYGDLQAAVGADRLKAVSFDSSTRGFTFMDMLLGHLVLGLWYWCTDQTIVQRALGARSAMQAQLGALFAGFLKLLPVFLMVIPGILAYALFREQVGTETKSVLPVLIMNLMPVGIRGLMLAAILAAVMSSVAAALNSCSTLVVFDVFDKLRPGLPDKAKVRIGKITTALVLVLAVSWSPFLADLGSIFELINQMFSIFAPAIVAVFLWGVVSTRGTATASFWTLTGGSLAGLCVFIIEKYIPIGGVANYISSPQGLGIHWLTQTYLFFFFSSAIYFSVTWLDRKGERFSGFNFTPGLPPARVVGVSVILMIALVAVYLFFY
jgi:solute:Na+ symporter, SSS family